MIPNVDTGHHTFYETDVNAVRGKAVVVVGDPAGIGLDTVALLAGEGARVFFAAENNLQRNKVLSAVNAVGGKARGVSVNLSDPEAVRAFFEQALSWLGKIEAVVSLINVETGNADDRETRQSLCTQEAIHHVMQSVCGQIIHVSSGHSKYETVKGYWSGRSIAPELRRQARELGIRVTLIEPSSEAVGVLSSADVARCVFNSLAQPFGVDVILMQGQFA